MRHLTLALLTLITTYPLGLSSAQGAPAVNAPAQKFILIDSFIPYKGRTNRGSLWEEFEATKGPVQSKVNISEADLKNGFTLHLDWDLNRASEIKSLLDHIEKKNLQGEILLIRSWKNPPENPADSVKGDVIDVRLDYQKMLTDRHGFIELDLAPGTLAVREQRTGKQPISIFMVEGDRKMGAFEYATLKVNGVFVVKEKFKMMASISQYVIPGKNKVELSFTQAPGKPLLEGEVAGYAVFGFWEPNFVASEEPIKSVLIDGQKIAAGAVLEFEIPPSEQQGLRGYYHKLAKLEQLTEADRAEIYRLLDTLTASFKQGPPEVFDGLIKTQIDAIKVFAKVEALNFPGRAAQVANFRKSGSLATSSFPTAANSKLVPIMAGLMWQVEQKEKGWSYYLDSKTELPWPMKLAVGKHDGVWTLFDLSL